MPACPLCGAEGIPIVYGMAGPDLGAKEAAGEVVLGGCVTGLADATWACRGPVQHRWGPEVDGRRVAGLLHEVLRIGDDRGLAQIRGRHLPVDVMADLVEQTYLYALAHAEADTDGWLVFRDGILPWWREVGNLTDHDERRISHLRTDVVKQLFDYGIVHRRHPRSTPLYIGWHQLSDDLIDDVDEDGAEFEPGDTVIELDENNVPHIHTIQEGEKR